MSKIILQADDGKYTKALTKNQQLGLYAHADSKEEATTLEVINHNYVMNILKNEQFGLKVPNILDATKTMEDILGGSGVNHSKRIVLRRGSEYVTLEGISLVFVPNINKAVYFEMANVRSNQIAFKAANGKFVSRHTLGSNMLMANRGALGSWETFPIIKVE